jgi:hypothetical protein
MVPSLAGGRARNPDNFDELGIFIPLIPCGACGRSLRYTEAAIVAIGVGGIGWGHRPGLCDPKDVASRTASLTRTY